MAHRQHHYVPKFLLEEWHAPPDNKLIQLQWIGSRLIHDRYKAKSVAKQPHLYSRRREDREPDVVIERDFLGPYVDDPASVVHKRIISGGVRSLTDGDKLAWGRFLVSLLLRTPAMIEHMRAKGRAALESGLDEKPEDFREVKGDTAEETLKEWVKKHRPWEFDDLGINTLPSLIGSELLNKAILKSIWATRTVGTPTHDLLIGDKPLIYLGQMETSFLIVLPLSPRQVFFAFNNKNTWENIARVNNKSVVSHINRASVGTADSYVYSTGLQHRQLVRKYLKARDTR